MEYLKEVLVTDQIYIYNACKYGATQGFMKKV